MPAPATALRATVVLASVLAATSRIAAEELVSYEGTVRPVLARYCFECHGEKKQKGEVDFERLALPEDSRQHEQLWELVAELLGEREMPPEKADQPELAERAAVIEWIRSAFQRPTSAGTDPGRVTMRRLNRFEYRNTIRDLLAVDYEPAEDFPGDDVGYGFDNIGDVLDLSPLLFERYLQAADEIAREAIVTEDPENPEVRHFEAEDATSTAKGGVYRGMRSLSTNGAVIVDVILPRDGVYQLGVRACGQQAGPEPCKMEIKAGGKRVRRFNVKATRDQPRVYRVEAHATGGETRIAVAFTNDYYKPDHPDRSQRDRNLLIDWVEVIGPIDAPPVPASHARVMICEPKSAKSWKLCARRILDHLVTRAYRRPARRSEVRRLLGLAEDAIARGESFPEAMQLGLQAILVSPQFLFRPEPRPARPPDPQSGEHHTAVPVPDHALASRLSYFLWGSMPDERLFALAATGELRDAIEDEAARMLTDPRTSALVDSFAAQWLQLRQLDLVTPDPDRFPTFDDDLRRDMRRETEMLFEAVVWQDLSVTAFLDPPFTYVNENLASHYRIEGVRGDRFRPVATGASGRGGILTHASVLTLTSYPTRTSPVKRGKWILEQILGAPPPPPPPGVPDLADGAEAEKSASVRERMQAHRANPDCASCHAKMDPLGFALERYDAIGRWRDRDGEHEIDDRGELPDGVVFHGARELAEALAGDGAFAHCLAEKLLTYALGRGLEDFDEAAVERIAARAAAEGYRFSAFVRGIVTSRPFLYTRPRRTTR